ncbi:unnamed protein product [Gordionus sp. m RMFG-2023]|uniref:protein FAM133B-like n=1 Tax=Gordionus sp. m RMFG-2023 TaxID=3053472 RepID=UPI0030E3BA57
MHLKPISKEAKNRLTQFMIEREFDRKSRHKRRKHKRSKKRYTSSSSNSSSSDSSRSSSGSRKSFRGSRKRSRSSNSTVSGRSTPSYGRGRSVKSAEKSEHRSSLEKYIIDDMIGEAPSTDQNQKIAKDGDTDLKKYPSSVNQNSGNHARVENKNLPLLNQYFDSAEDST